MRKYTIISTQYSENDFIESNCNAIQFTNRGDESVTVNGEPIPAGEQMTINGLAGEEDTTSYRLIFDSADANPAVYVKRKMYVE